MSKTTVEMCSEGSTSKAGCPGQAHYHGFGQTDRVLQPGGFDSF